jgi:hypothetical protein
MRPIIALLAAGICWGQPVVSTTTPVVIGWPSKVMRFNDGNSSFFFGDTLYTAMSQSGARYFASNDCWWISSSQFSNTCMSKMTAYDNAVPANNNWVQWDDNTFRTGYLFSENTSTNCSGGCTVRTRNWSVIAGKGYLNVMVEAGDGNPQHSSFVRTDNVDASPPLWKNPAHLAFGGNANGDMPNWAAADSSVMFPVGAGAGPNKFGHIVFIIPANYVDDGVHCPVIPTSMGGDGSGNYVYAYSDDGLRLYGPHRVLCSNLPNLNASQWETYTGSAWTSNLSNPRKIADLCWCLGPQYGAWNLGTSFQYTLIPDLGAIVGVGQVYQYTYTTLSNNTYYPTLQLSTATSIFGPFTPAPAGQLPPLVFQTGTNPRTRKLNGAIGSATPGTSQTVTMTVPYSQGLEPQIFPFDITVDGEVMRVTAAALDSYVWTVTRGINGTAPAHADQAQVLAPYRIQMNLASFVPGTYTFANGVAGVDMIFDGGQSDGTVNDSTKAHAVYGPYIGRVTFQNAPQQRTNVRGNTPIRLGNGHVGKLAFDSSHLVSFMDFNEHAGNPYYGKIASAGVNQTNLMRPTDLVGTLACVPTNDCCGERIHWSAYGMQMLNSDGLNARCVTTGNTPITGSSPRTVTIVFRTTDVTANGGPILYEQTSGGSTAQFDGFVTGNGAWWNCFDVACVITSPGVVANNSWVAITSVYKGGRVDGSSGPGTGFSIYKNGVYTCGPAGPTPCPGGTGGANVLNTSASPINIGGTSPYNQPFPGEIAGLIFHNAGLNTPDIAEFYAALKAAYSRRGIALP